ncbi:response regulator transcription factor [Cumulibacter soli]|uniref:response regulator transcription factor n=1 Tax=Cumulibacter soli TaxID=2546344 RepID=UPI001067BD00|nr:response regulator transcription factor [Cumulibacter soli]
MAATEQLSVLVVDDHQVFTDLMVFTLRGMTFLRTVRSASSIAQAREALLDEHVDVAVVDVRLPDGTGVDLVPFAATHSTRVILLTGHPRRAEAARAIDLGASGYLAKDGSLSTLTAALSYASPSQPHVADRFPEDSLAGGSLTDRERQVLIRIVDGQDATRIAADLELSVLTVRGHIKAVLAKLGVRSQLEAVALASRAGVSARPRG